MTEIMTKRVVLTGGPCAGKTTVLSKIRERLLSFGWNCVLVPETATLFMNAGINLKDATRDQLLTRQRALLRQQIRTENNLLEAASSFTENTVLLCDRGAMDSSAYMKPEDWAAILDDLSLTRVDIRDRRYDAVIHMVTAADGAEEFYTLANNSVRSESLEQARILDRLVQEAWIGHPHLRVVGNETDFEGKVRRTMGEILSFLGIPEPREIERKFLLKVVSDIPVHHQTVDIEQTYLISTNGSEMRVRRRGQGGSYTYTHTTKKQVGKGERIEIERALGPREYIALLKEADPARHTIRKRRTCFLWEGRYFELDEFDYPHKGLLLLELEVGSLDEKFALPPFLEVEREVTGDKQYSNGKLSLK